MKHCLNEDCPFRKKHGYPIEFQDVVDTCSDCGSALSVGFASSPEASTASETSTPAHLIRRLFVTLAILVVAWASEKVAIPFLSSDIRQEALLMGATENLGITSLGLMPLITAAILVEVAALLIPPLRAYRTGGPTKRLSLWRATLVVTLVLALFQSFAISTFLLQLDPYPDSILAFHAVNMASLVAGTFFLLGLAGVIGRWGMGNGIAILIAGALLRLSFDTVQYLGRAVKDDIHTPFEIAIALGGTAFIAFATYRAARLRTPTQREHRIPAAGLVPYSTTGSLLMLPATLAAWGLSLPDHERLLPSEGIVPTLVILALSIALVWPWTWIFHHPRRVGKLIHDAMGASLSEQDAVAQARSMMKSAVLKSAFYIGVIVLASSLASTVLPLTASMGALGIALATAVVLDVVDEWRMRQRSDDFVSLWEEHRVYAADMALELLERESIPTILRGVHYRTLTQFFAPYVPIHILVPTSQVEKAKRVIAFLAR
jgi:preprotein translocase subunit SecY